MPSLTIYTPSWFLYFYRNLFSLDLAGWGWAVWSTDASKQVPLEVSFNDASARPQLVSLTTNRGPSNIHNTSLRNKQSSPSAFLCSWQLNFITQGIPPYDLQCLIWVTESRLSLAAWFVTFINTLNDELNPICHMLVLLEVHLIFHFGRIKVKGLYNITHHISITKIGKFKITVGKVHSFQKHRSSGKLSRVDC